MGAHRVAELPVDVVFEILKATGDLATFVRGACACRQLHDILCILKASPPDLVDALLELTGFRPVVLLSAWCGIPCDDKLRLFKDFLSNDQRRTYRHVAAFLPPMVFRRRMEAESLTPINIRAQQYSLQARFCDVLLAHGNLDQKPSAKLLIDHASRLGRPWTALVSIANACQLSVATFLRIMSADAWAVYFDSRDIHPEDVLLRENPSAMHHLCQCMFYDADRVFPSLLHACKTFPGLLSKVLGHVEVRQSVKHALALGNVAVARVLVEAFVQGSEDVESPQPWHEFFGSEEVTHGLWRALDNGHDHGVKIMKPALHKAGIFTGHLGV